MDNTTLDILALREVMHDNTGILNAVYWGIHQRHGREAAELAVNVIIDSYGGKRPAIPTRRELAERQKQRISADLARNLPDEFRKG